MMFSMKLFRNRAAVLQDLEERLHDSLAQIPALVESAMPSRRTKAQAVAVTAAWVAAGVGVLTLGLIAGRELRIRYKFKRRTPYDYYAQAGDPQDLEFGIGI
jgi:hypothetical protein